MTAEQRTQSRGSWLSVAEMFNLQHACRMVTAAHWGFGTYLVGSCMDRADYRDVDLRCILADDEFDVMFKDQPQRLKLMNVALSEWLAARTGLPIDFQFQRQTEANAEFGDRPRNRVGMPLDPRVR